MDTTVSVIVFLAPGLLAAKIVQAMDPEFKDRNFHISELESTVFAVLNNVPGILVGWLLWSLRERKNLSFDQWAQQIVGFRGALLFILISFTLAFWVEKSVKPSLKLRVAAKRADARKEKGLPAFEDAET